MKILALIAVLALSVVPRLRAEPTQGVVKPFRTIFVPSPVLQEIISEIHVEEGTEVRKGQVLVQLRADRETLDVKLSEKLIELKRFIAAGQEKLYQEKMGSEEKAREARTELEISVLQLEAKKVALEEKTIRATMDGVIVKKFKEAGEAVDRAEKLLEMMNYDQVIVEFYIKPELRKNVKQNDKVRVRFLDLDNSEIEGRVDLVDPRNDSASSLVRIKVLVDNQDHRIKPGMKSMAEFGK